jgi:predicted Zn-dependent peptidase
MDNKSSKKHRHPSKVRFLPNGLASILTPLPHAQSVSVGVWVRAGGRCEPGELSGISHFLEHLLFKGTLRRSCEALKQAIEGVGGALNGFTAEEHTCYMAKVPHRYARRALNILADMVRHPRMHPRDIEKEREVIIEEIRMYEDSPGQNVMDLMNALMWPNHPLGRILSGTIDTVRRIKRKDLLDYWRRMYQPQNYVVAAAGAFEPGAIEQAVGQEFGILKRGRAARFAPVGRIPRTSQVRVWKKPTEQTHLCMGIFAVPRTHPDRFALEMLHVILGANMSSRLFREVREKRGLVYEIGTHIKRYEDAGAFVISAGCDQGKLSDTLKTIAAELLRLRKTRVGPTELARAKEFYAGQLSIGLEDTMEYMLWEGEQVAMTNHAPDMGKLLAHLNRVSAADLQHVARKLFRPERVHLAVVGAVAQADAARWLAAAPW